MRWLLLMALTVAGCSNEAGPVDPMPEPEPFRVELRAFVDSRDVSDLNGIEGHWLCRLDLLALAVGESGHADLGNATLTQMSPEPDHRVYPANVFWSLTDLPAGGFRTARLSIFATNAERIAYQVEVAWATGGSVHSEVIPVECVPS